MYERLELVGMSYVFLVVITLLVTFLIWEVYIVSINDGYRSNLGVREGSSVQYYCECISLHYFEGCTDIRYHCDH